MVKAKEIKNFKRQAGNEDKPNGKTYDNKKKFSKSERPKNDFKKQDKKQGGFKKFTKEKRPNDSGDFEKREKRRRELDSNTLELRKLYNKLMLKKDNNKPEIVKKMLALIKENYKEFAFKHDGCRFFQGCIKYGSKEQRNNLIENLKDILNELATKKYSIFLAIKIWKFATKTQQEELALKIKSELSSLVRSPSGEMFINFVFTNSSQKIMEMFEEDYWKFVLKIDRQEMKNLELYKIESKKRKNSTVSNESDGSKMEIEEDANNNIIVKRIETFGAEKFKERLELILEKQLHRNFVFHYCLNNSFDLLDLDTKIYLTELFDDDFDAFTNNKISMELGLKLYLVATSKTKKKIIKKIFKEDWCGNLLSFDFNSILLSKILLSTDDTKLSSKYILKPLIAFTEQNDFTVFTKILSGFITPQKDKILSYINNSSSKKDTVKVQTEILASCKSDLIKLIDFHFDKFTSDKELGSFLLELISFIIKLEHLEIDKEERNKICSLLTGFLKEILQILMTKLKVDYEKNKQKILINNSFFITQLLKKLIPKEIANRSKDPSIAEFIKSLSNIIISSIEPFLKSKAIFYILHIINDEEHGKLVKKDLIKNYSLLEKIMKDQKLNKESAVGIILDILKK